MAAPARPLTLPVIVIALGTIGYVLAASIAAAVLDNTEFVFYIAVMLVLMASVGATHWRLILPAGMLAALSAWGLLHMAGGLVPVPESWPIAGDQRVLYSWQIVMLPGWGWLKYDQVVHAYGFGVTTWLCWSCLARWMVARDLVPRPSLGLLVLCIAAGCGFGAFNEVVEYAATTFTTTNVGGYENTARDLVSNLVGSVVAAMMIRVRADDGIGDGVDVLRVT